MKNVCLVLIVLMVFSGCSKNDSSSGSSGSSAGTENTTTILTPYDFANGCYILKSLANSRYVVGTGARYAASTTESGKATPFYMKPSGLGTYLLYDRYANYLSVDAGQGVVRTGTLDDNDQWELTAIGENIFALKSLAQRMWLTVPDNGSRLVLSDTCGANARFQIEPGAGCRAFPEAELNVDIQDKAGNPVSPDMAMARPAVGQPIIGYADAHVHLNHFLGSGQTTFVGETFDPLGIAVALQDCSPLHGPNGSYDLLGMVQDKITSHKTDGWPTFSYWPTSYSQTHQQAYYRWIERAWLSGQRLMVQEMVSAEVLAKVKNILPPYKNAPENDMVVVDLQIANMYAMQDYIDAQCGGPGKGWFRICKSSREARQAISQGKMAVILAIEVDTVFNGDRDYITDYEEGRITKQALDAKLADIRAQIDKYYDLGVRTVFPLHGINNGYGGAWLYVNLVWNIGNKIMRGEFYEVEESPNPRVTYHESGIEYSPENKAWIDLLRFLGIDLPYVPKTDKGMANKQGLTKLGAWLIKELINKGIVIEIDHMSNRTVNKALDIIWEAKYPGVVATHGRITDLYPPDGKTYEQLDIPHMIKILQLGGLFSAHYYWAFTGDQYCYLDYLQFMIDLSARAKKEGKSLVATLDNEHARQYYFQYDGPYQVPSSWYNTNDDPSDDLVLGLTLTTDVNGACSLPQPDLSATHVPVEYGFGPLYPGLYNESVVDPAKVRFQRQVTGKRTFDVNYDGMAHYGLLPDYIKDRQVQDPSLTLNGFFHGAEAYLRMLERVERYHADPHYPSRNAADWPDLDAITDYWRNPALQ